MILAALKLQPIYDEVLGEDIAWRIEFLQMHLGYADLTELDLPKIVQVAYTPLPGDDHDHCLGCWRKFMKNGGPETDDICWADNPDTRLASVMLCSDCYRILAEVRAGRIKVIEK